MRRYIAILLMLLLAPAVLAQTVPLTRGTRLVALGDLSLRETEPHGTYYTKGEQRDVLRRGEQVIVQDHRIIKTIVGESVWARVIVVSRRAPTQPLWVYVGETTGAANLRPLVRGR